MKPLHKRDLYVCPQCSRRYDLPSTIDATVIGAKCPVCWVDIQLVAREARVGIDLPPDTPPPR
jgi:DNA-directed RNA polymerase subunit RPC12/RpoP